MRLEDIKSVYFIGIGGIGMSAIARWFKKRDVAVAGYDRTKTPLCVKLEWEGILIHYNEDLSKIEDRRNRRPLMGRKKFCSLMIMSPWWLPYM